MRIDQIAGLALDRADGRGDFVLVGAIGGEQGADLRQAHRADSVKRRDCASEPISARMALPSRL